MSINENCVVIEESTRSEKIGQLIDDIARLSNEVKDEACTLYIYLHGPVPQNNTKDAVSNSSDGFYGHLECQLLYIKNNLSDIRQCIKGFK